MASLKCMNRQVTHQVSSSVLPSNSSLGGATLAGLRRLLLVQFLTIVHRKRFPTALRQVYQGVVEQDHLSCKLEAKALQAVLVAAACSGGIQAVAPSVETLAARYVPTNILAWVRLGLQQETRLTRFLAHLQAGCREAPKVRVRPGQLVRAQEASMPPALCVPSI
eukprot:CAMPEP_0172899724 /NCGR_PEP_ID=MMETSP1075-20121228/162526_1 /TAXON_ID=2916 /ORGANISM="Ceratium fusus, Strain PA161109" /LENGTH=164 /DNA_ID=CAMNT_0013755779 /DNA_START=67 /DNA_END=562 /DNA_ORIENTATION=+